MAHMPALRESGSQLLRHVRNSVARPCRRALQHVPTACELCQGRSQGGSLCTYCHGAVIESMANCTARCPVCRVLLDARGQCPDCSLQPPAFDRIIAAFDYAAPGDLLIHRLKSSHRFITAGMLAGLLADAVHVATPGLPGNTILVPVPASRAAILRRGFNPAAEIALCLASHLQLACRPGLLTRVHEGVKQTHLGRHERSRSVQALYRCAMNLNGFHIGVVDDVLTTGSTLHSIAQAFKAQGAATVTGLVLARTPYARQF